MNFTLIGFHQLIENYQMQFLDHLSGTPLFQIAGSASVYYVKMVVYYVMLSMLAMLILASQLLLYY